MYKNKIGSKILFQIINKRKNNGSQKERKKKKERKKGKFDRNAGAQQRG